MWLDFDVRDNRGWTFSLKEAILWTEDYFSRKQQFKVKNILMDLFILSSQDVNWWTGVVWITCGYSDGFISCLDSHSDGTHSLQRIIFLVYCPFKLMTSRQPQYQFQQFQLLYFYFISSYTLTLTNTLSEMKNSPFYLSFSCFILCSLFSIKCTVMDNFTK